MRIETCVIIVNYNGKNLLKDCLDSIKKYMPDKAKIIVVDNNSRDGSLKMLKDSYSFVDVVVNKSNRGFSGANNDGIKYSHKKYNPSYYYFLNNDTKVTSGFIQQLIDAAKKDKKIGLLGSSQKNFKGEDAISSGDIGFFGVKYYFGKEPREIGWVSGAAFMVTKEVVEDIGGFDEVYNPAYYEESDWEERIRGVGYKICVIPASMIYHKGGASTKNYPLNLLEVFYKNRIRFFIKYRPLCFISRFFVDVFRSIGKNCLKSLFLGYFKGLKSLRKKEIFKIA